ncbi:MAG: tRNA (N(6)-L-threonylcarbamoyladenosine(37)-C(2))-methylthiotransferase MtaB [Chlamydiia bacterium]|nr:tRNA (N(6)-L-threonylcarbamoyladenosine(37)-C(2))-methylthiotransferase MtaB [Chlamydiia bacterium]
MLWPKQYKRSQVAAKTFKVVTLGCRTNQYESQGYVDQLKKLGYTEGEDADICVVNTCTVTESADSSSRHQIRDVLRNNPKAKVMVTGCYADGKPDEILAIDPRIEVVRNKQKESLLQIALPEVEEIPEFKIERFEAHTRAFLKVQDGCNSFCSYCIIPYVRGRSRSRTQKEILEEAKGLIHNGYKEIVITGINIGDYDGGGDDNLAGLVRALDELEGLERLRISSIDPDEVDDNLLDAVINGKKTSPSMHVVLQSGSNHVLKRMNRKYTRQMFLSTIDRLKGACPDFTFTTDIIVGFPGESERDFEESLEMMREVKFSKVHMFPYSERKRTKAALFHDKVPHAIIKERKAKMLQLAEEVAYELREAYVGRVMKVLIENGNQGHTDNFLPVILQGIEALPNDIVEVELYENTPKGLLGRCR